MIIDLILDRKDGERYDPEKFYRDVMGYGSIGNDITRALDGGTNADVVKELCNYIDKQNYNPKIKDYIKSVKWLNDSITKDSIVNKIFKNNGTELRNALEGEYGKGELRHLGNYSFEYTIESGKKIAVETSPVGNGYEADKIKVNSVKDSIKDDAEFDYKLLGRLESDCKYFLGSGNGFENDLWAGSVDKQIAKMRSIYNSLKEKPDWISLEDINNYESKMKNFKKSKNDSKMFKVTDKKTGKVRLARAFDSLEAIDKVSKVVKNLIQGGEEPYVITNTSVKDMEAVSNYEIKTVKDANYKNYSVGDLVEFAGYYGETMEGKITKILGQIPGADDGVIEYEVFNPKKSSLYPNGYTTKTNNSRILNKINSLKDSDAYVKDAKVLKDVKYTWVICTGWRSNPQLKDGGYDVVKVCLTDDKQTALKWANSGTSSYGSVNYDSANRFIGTASEVKAEADSIKSGNICFYTGPNSITYFSDIKG